MNKKPDRATIQLDGGEEILASNVSCSHAREKFDGLILGPPKPYGNIVIVSKKIIDRDKFLTMKIRLFNSGKLQKTLHFYSVRIIHAGENFYNFYADKMK